MRLNKFRVRQRKFEFFHTLSLNLKHMQTLCTVFILLFYIIFYVFFFIFVFHAKIANWPLHFQVFLSRLIFIRCVFLRNLLAFWVLQHSEHWHFCTNKKQTRKNQQANSNAEHGNAALQAVCATNLLINSFVGWTGNERATINCITWFLFVNSFSSIIQQSSSTLLNYFSIVAHSPYSTSLVGNWVFFYIYTIFG